MNDIEYGLCNKDSNVGSICCIISNDIEFDAITVYLCITDNISVRVCSLVIDLKASINLFIFVVKDSPAEYECVRTNGIDSITSCMSHCLCSNI